MNPMLGLVEGSPERQAIDAGEIDAVVDYSTSKVVLLPAARRALRELAGEASIANHLLAALPAAEYQSLLPRLEPLTVKFGEVLEEQGVPVRYIYFPIDCMISLLTTAEHDRALEVGLVGYEGVVGTSLVLGAEISSVRAVVQAGGTALRMKGTSFVEAFRQCLPLQRVLLRYAHEELVQARTTAACKLFHAVEARLARRLLMTSDRLRSLEFVLTQALVAKMLGVRRATVNEAAGLLQQRRLIDYCRGKVTILDRKGLEAASCRCYATMNELQMSQ
ncbi:MAG TPA: Crp/Fnr family transcriptional regulator [Burkholderiales bacterium]|nr:Crp/Fnr family transcriptional regulator [Burkholderiales bacterium]